MTDRGREIEAIFYLMLRLAGMGFGFLMIAAGILYALAFGVQQLGTGVVALNGREYASATARALAIGVPLAVAAAGFGLVRLVNRRAR